MLDRRAAAAGFRWRPVTSADLGSARRKAQRRLAMCQEPAWPPDHDRDHRRANDQHAELGKRAAEFRASVTSRIAASTTPIWLPMPPSTTIARIVADFDKCKTLGADEALPRRKKTAGKAAEHRADAKGGELDIGWVDAERATGDLILAQRFPGASDRQSAQAQGEQVGDERQSQDDEIDEDDPLVGREFEPEKLMEGGDPLGRRAGEAGDQRTTAAGCPRSRSVRR